MVSATPSPSAERADRAGGSGCRRLRRLSPRTFQGRLTLAFVGRRRADAGPRHGPRPQPPRRLLHDPAAWPTSTSRAKLGRRRTSSRARRAGRDGRPVVDVDERRRPVACVAGDLQPRSSSGSSPTGSPRPTSTSVSGRYATDGETLEFVPADSTGCPHPARRLRPDPARPGARAVAARQVLPVRATDVFGQYAVEVTPVQPVHLPGDRDRQRHRPAGRHRPVRAGAERPRLGGDGPPLHDPAPAPDRGIARAGRGRPDAGACPSRRGPGRLVGAGRARRPVQRDGRPARGERRDHPPRPRPEPRLPGRRLARAADAARGPADVQRAARGAAPATTPRPAPSSSSRAASRSSGSTGSPRTCSSSRSSIPGSSCSTCGRTTCGRPSRSAVEQARPAAAAAGRPLSLDLPDAPVRIRHDPQRIGQVVDQPRRQRDQVHAARRLGRRSRSRATPRRRPDRGGRHGRRHRRRPSCRTSSSGSTAARGRTRRAAAAAASAWRSSARSSTCTAARSSSRAGSGPARRFTVDAAARSAARGGTPAARARGCRIGRRAQRSAATGACDRGFPSRRSADRQRAGNFTDRTPAGESNLHREADRTALATEASGRPTDARRSVTDRTAVRPRPTAYDRSEARRRSATERDASTTDDPDPALAERDRHRCRTASVPARRRARRHIRRAARLASDPGSLPTRRPVRRTLRPVRRADAGPAVERYTRRPSAPDWTRTWDATPSRHARALVRAGPAARPRPPRRSADERAAARSVCRGLARPRSSPRAARSWPSARPALSIGRHPAPRPRSPERRAPRPQPVTDRRVVGDIASPPRSARPSSGSRSPAAPTPATGVIPRDRRRLGRHLRRRTAGSSPTTTSSRAATRSTVELKDGRSLHRHGLRHRHADRPRDRQDRRDRTCRPPRSATPTRSRSASSSSPSAARSGTYSNSGHERHRVGQGPLDHDRRQPAAQQPDPDRRRDQPRQLAAARCSTRGGNVIGINTAIAADSNGHRLRHPDRHRPADHGSRRSPASSWPARTSASATSASTRQLADDGQAARRARARSSAAATARAARPGGRSRHARPTKAGIKDGDIIVERQRQGDRRRASARRDAQPVRAGRHGRPSTSCATARRRRCRSRSGRDPNSAPGYGPRPSARRRSSPRRGAARSRRRRSRAGRRAGRPACGPGRRPRRPSNSARSSWPIASASASSRRNDVDSTICRTTS